MTVRAIVIAVHGILTRTTEPSWPDELDAYLDDCKVERRYYFAGPFPIIEHFIRNRSRAATLAAEIEILHGERPTIPLHIVTHSNGGDIAGYLVQLLAKRKIRVETAILTAAVVDPQVKTTPFARAIVDGWLGKAYAYCSKSDRALGIPEVVRWPYKSLGISGWMDGDKSYAGPRLITRRFDAYDHGDYFSLEHRAATFAEMRADMLL